MIEIFSLSEANALRNPRRIRKYVLIWCSSGNITVKVDEGEFMLTPNSVITITSGQVHHVIDNNNVEGWVLEFTYDFFCKDDNDIELIFHNSLFCHFAMNEVIQLGTSDVVGTELVRIAGELNHKPYQYHISVHSRMELILVEINRQKIKSGGEVWKPDALFLKFLEAIREKFSKNPKPEDLAKIIGCTPAKLNEQSKKFTGRTAQSVIHGLVASEAKRLFMYDRLSVKEVAFALGFKDPFYFSNFFKKETGVSPKEYRENVGNAGLQSHN